MRLRFKVNKQGERGALARAAGFGLALGMAGWVLPGAAAAADRLGLPQPDSACAQPTTASFGSGLRGAQAYLAACSEAEVVGLTHALVGFPTVRGAAPNASAAAEAATFAAMGAYLREWTAGAGLGFAAFGDHAVWEVWAGAQSAGGKSQAKTGAAAADVAFVMHGDVVPAGDTTHDGASADTEATPNAAWQTPPFKALLRDGRLIGRGVEDDKGPIAAVLVTLKALAAFDLVPAGKRVMAIIGNDEESSWAGMEKYVAAHPQPHHVISVDAEFPVIVAESGFVSWYLAAPKAVPSAAAQRTGVRGRYDGYVAGMAGGAFLSQVPGTAGLTVGLLAGQRSKARLARLQRRVQRAITTERELREGRGEAFEFTADTDREAKQVTITVHGQAVHSSTAENGHNALWALASLSQRLRLLPSGATVMLSLIARTMDQDHYGERLGLAYSHPVMGKLLLVPTVLRVDEDSGEARLAVNLRRPAGMSSAAFGRQLKDAVGRVQRVLKLPVRMDREPYVGKPLLVDPDSRLVRTLLDVYAHHTGTVDPQPRAERGSTYAKLFKQAVSFGPSFPDQPYQGHRPNESVAVADLTRLSAMTLDASVRLLADGADDGAGNGSGERPETLVQAARGK